MRTVPSENILKLRKLTDEICNSESRDEYKEIVLNLKSFLIEGDVELSKYKTIKHKVKTYENILTSFTKILNTAVK
jgi:hypothetical protein